MSQLSKGRICLFFTRLHCDAIGLFRASLLTICATMLAYAQSGPDLTDTRWNPVEGAESFFQRAWNAENVPAEVMGLGLHITLGKPGYVIVAKSLWKGGVIDEEGWEGTYDGRHLSLKRRGLKENANELLMFEGDVHDNGTRLRGTYKYSLHNQLFNEDGSMSADFQREGGSSDTASTSTSQGDSAGSGSSGPPSVFPGPLSLPSLQVPSWASIPLIGIGGILTLLGTLAAGAARTRGSNPPTEKYTSEEWCEKNMPKLQALKNEYNRRRQVAETVQAALEDAAKFNGAVNAITQAHKILDDTHNWVRRDIVHRLALTFVAGGGAFELIGGALDRIASNLFTLLSGFSLSMMGSIPEPAYGPTGKLIEGRIMIVLGKVLGSIERAKAACTAASRIGGYTVAATTAYTLGQWRDQYIRDMLGAIADGRLEVKKLEMSLNIAREKLQQVKLKYGSEPITAGQMSALGDEIHALGKECYNRCFRFGAQYVNEWDRGDWDRHPQVDNDWLAQQIGYKITP